MNAFVANFIGSPSMSVFDVAGRARRVRTHVEIEPPV